MDIYIYYTLLYKKFPEFYNFPPFFTIQPVLETREKQLALWRQLILDYHTFQKIKTFPRNSLITTQQLSVIRFVIFSHQFYFLLLIFGVEITYSLALATIFSMYFLASIVPSIHLMDVAIKGSVAVVLFGKLGVNQWTIVSITTLMWLLNLVIPVLIGSLFVLKFKPKLGL